MEDLRHSESIQCECADGRRVLAIPTRSDDQYRLFVAREESMTPLPMRLDLRSWAWSRVAVEWPPTYVIDIECDDAGITMEFAEPPWFDLPSLPFDLDREAVWRARYDWTGRRWRLTRLRFYDVLPPKRRRAGPYRR